jgi:hypothetical protein
MADAALGFTQAGVATEEIHVDDLMLPLYGQAFDALDPTDIARRARLLGHIAVGNAWKRDGHRAREARERARELAVAAADDATLAHVLACVRQCLIGTVNIEAQIAVEDTLLELAARRDDPRGRARALLWRFQTNVECGRGDELEDLLAEAGALVAALPDAAYHHVHAHFEATLELIRGDVERADRAVEHAAWVGRDRGLADQAVESTRLAQLFDVRTEQGRLADLRDDLVAFVSVTDIWAMRVFLATVNGELGELDGVAEAIDAVLADLVEKDTRSTVPVVGQGSLVVSIERLGEPARAELLYDLLAPYPGRSGALYPLTASDVPLGRLARMLGRADDAQRHFADGIAFADRLGAPLIRDRCRAAIASGRSASAGV